MMTMLQQSASARKVASLPRRPPGMRRAFDILSAVHRQIIDTFSTRFSIPHADGVIDEELKLPTWHVSSVWVNMGVRLCAGEDARTGWGFGSAPGFLSRGLGFWTLLAMAHGVAPPPQNHHPPP